MMAIYRGVVKNGIIVLENGVQLPDGTMVEVRVTANLESDAFERVICHRRQNAGYFVGMDEILAEERHEREERVNSWITKSEQSA